MIYAQRKMPQYFYENSEPDMPHWCVALIPDDEQATITFLPGSQSLTLEQAEKKSRGTESEIKSLIDSLLFSNLSVDQGYDGSGRGPRFTSRA